MLFLNNTEETPTFILLCKCGCNSGLCFRYIDGEILVSAFESSFYARQRTAFDIVRDIIRMLKKPFPIAEIICNENDLKRLFRWLQKHKTIMHGENNYSKLKLKDISEDKNKLYSLEIVPRLTKLEILTGKIYKACELTIDEGLQENLLRKIRKLLAENATDNVR